MATSKSWAQDVITSDLCDKATQQFCNSCQVKLCESCVKKHRDENKSLPHEIVHFLERKFQLVFSECKEHPGQRCEVNCKTCNKPVCLKCIVSGSHKGHDVEELTKIHDSATRKIKSETEEIKSKIIPEYQNQCADIENQISKAKLKLENLTKESKQLRKLWHQEVDTIFDTIDSISLSLGEENINSLQAYHTEIKNLISDINKTIQENAKLLISKSVSEVKSYQSKLKEYRDFPRKMEVNLPSLISNIDEKRDLSIGIGEFRATLKQVSQQRQSGNASLSPARFGEIMDQAKVIVNSPVNYSTLRGVACVGESEAWIYGSGRNITRVDIYGAVKDKVVTTDPSGPGDISVTREGQLIYSDWRNGTVKVFGDRKFRTLITLPQDWKPSNLSCSKYGDILVHVRIESGAVTRNKILCYQGQNIKQEINDDGKGNPIFKEGPNELFMAMNKNRDVCVSDASAGNVVVVDKTGRVRFRYDGSAGSENPFIPKSIVTDALSQIIVADWYTNCLHILDQNGQFLT